MKSIFSAIVALVIVGSASAASANPVVDFTETTVNHNDQQVGR